jgi:hypothetical protein
MRDGTQGSSRSNGGMIVRIFQIHNRFAVADFGLCTERVTSIAFMPSKKCALKGLLAVMS